MIVQVLTEINGLPGQPVEERVQLPVDPAGCYWLGFFGNLGVVADGHHLVFPQLRYQVVPGEAFGQLD
jgi:hypothetical protein